MGKTEQEKRGIMEMIPQYFLHRIEIRRVRPPLHTKHFSQIVEKTHLISVAIHTANRRSCRKIRKQKKRRSRRNLLTEDLADS